MSSQCRCWFCENCCSSRPYVSPAATFKVVCAHRARQPCSVQPFHPDWEQPRSNKFEQDNELIDLLTILEENYFFQLQLWSELQTSSLPLKQPILSHAAGKRVLTTQNIAVYTGRLWHILTGFCQKNAVHLFCLAKSKKCKYLITYVKVPPIKTRSKFIACLQLYQIRSGVQKRDMSPNHLYVNCFTILYNHTHVVVVSLSLLNIFFSNTHLISSCSYLKNPHIICQKISLWPFLLSCVHIGRKCLQK